MWSAILAFFAGLVGKLWGRFVTPSQSPAQAAVNTEEKMAQIEANPASETQTEKDLRDGSF